MLNWYLKNSRVGKLRKRFEKEVIGMLIYAGVSLIGISIGWILCMLFIDKTRETSGTLHVVRDKIEGIGIYLELDDSPETLVDEKTVTFKISHK